MSMPRGAAIVYPKDAAQIVMQADVFPGRRWSRPEWGRAPCRCRCFVRWGRRAGSYRSSGEKTSPRSPAATSRPSSASSRTPGASSSAISSSSCPPSFPPDPSIASCSTCWPRGSASTSSPTRSRPGSGALLHRDRHAALARRGVHPQHRTVHGSGRLGDDGARLARRGPRGASRSPDGRAHRLPADRASSGSGHGRTLREATRLEVQLRRRRRGAVDFGAVGDREITDKNLRKRARGLRAPLRRAHRDGIARIGAPDRIDWRACVKRPPFWPLSASPSSL